MLADAPQMAWNLHWDNEVHWPESSRCTADTGHGFLMMRLRSSHLLIVVAIALLVLAVAGFVQTSKPEPVREHPAAAATMSRLRSVAPKAVGRERCMQRCAAIHKGYVYGAEQHLGGVGSPVVQPEVCSCV